MTRTVVYTLDARDNVMLEVMRDYFNLTPAVMLREIQGMVTLTEEILASKGIRYRDLRSVLVPSTKKREIALVFDTSVMTEGFYGLPIHTRLLPLFSKGSSHSVLVGDYIGDAQDHLYDALAESLNLVRDVDWTHSSQFYIIYINNLSDRMFRSLCEGFVDYPPFAGYADMTYGSRLKLYLSTMLITRYIKHRNTILMGHEDDVDNTEDLNMAGYPFQKFGFAVRSLQRSLFDLLLSYKIERPVFPGLEVDTELSLNAVNPNPLPLSSFDILIEDNKFAYLADQKTWSLKGIGVFDGGPNELKALITKKISSNYIYNLIQDEELGTTRFNVLLEVLAPQTQDRFRVLAALEYIPDHRQLRLITLY